MYLRGRGTGIDAVLVYGGHGADEMRGPDGEADLPAGDAEDLTSAVDGHGAVPHAGQRGYTHRRCDGRKGLLELSCVRIYEYNHTCEFLVCYRLNT